MRFWTSSIAVMLGALAPTAGRAEAPAFLYGEDVAPSSLNPIYTTSMVEVRLAELVYQGLFSSDQLLNPVAELAKSWVISDDKRQIRVQLEPSTWHDGKPVTADDVVYTIASIKLASAQSPLRSGLSFVRSATALTPQEVVITFEEPVVDPLSRLTFKIVPQHLSGGILMNPRQALRVKPVGSGPYAFDKTANNTTELRRVKEKKGALARIFARIVPDKRVQLDFIQYDALHAIIRVLPKHRPIIKGMSEKIALIPYESLSWWYVGVNHRHPALRDINVRRALTHALDRENMRKAHLGDGKTISGPFAPRSPFYEHSAEPYAFDVSAAQAAMRKAGYAAGSGGFERGGARLALRMTLKKSLSPYKDVCLDIQTHFKKAGFDVSLEWLDDAAYQERVVAKGDFDLTIGVWSFDEGSNILPLFHSTGAKNYVGYASKRMDGLLDQSLRTYEPELYKQIYRKVHEVAHDELPYVFLWSVTSYTAVSTQVKGVDIHPFRYFTWAEDWQWR